jgi:hypothetical protein
MNTRQSALAAILNAVEPCKPHEAVDALLRASYRAGYPLKFAGKFLHVMSKQIPTAAGPRGIWLQISSDAAHMFFQQFLDRAQLPRSQKGEIIKEFYRRTSNHDTGNRLKWFSCYWRSLPADEFSDAEHAFLKQKGFNYRPVNR